MANKLIIKLSELELYKKSLIRQINVYCYDKKKKNLLFEELQKVENDIKKLKFQLRLEREIKNANNNTEQSNN